MFERSLDPAKRSQLGAHYTGRRDIERVVDPVVMTPLRRRWDEVRSELETIRVASEAAPTPTRRRNQLQKFAQVQGAFLHELASVRVLDPACGSGNFLYVAMGRLLELEKEVIRFGAEAGLPVGIPNIRPTQMLGMEIDPLARELAQVAIWIGYLQWMIANGFGWKEPVLETLVTIRLQDALLDLSDGKASEAVWPDADFIVGNPPFLGGSKFRRELGGEYTERLFNVFGDRLPNFSDLVGYFFEKARHQLSSGRARRAGLLATNSIRGGANRRVLERIKASGDIYMAWSDEPWILDGAAVRISIIGFDDGRDVERVLNGLSVSSINPDLTANTNASSAVPLRENALLAFKGIEKSGPFDIPEDQAQVWLSLPLNPNGRPNSDVLKPWLNGSDVVQRNRRMWIIDFGPDLSQSHASMYEAPFEYIRTHVKPIRDSNRRDRRRES